MAGEPSAGRLAPVPGELAARSRLSGAGSWAHHGAAIPVPAGRALCHQPARHPGDRRRLQRLQRQCGVALLAEWCRHRWPGDDHGTDGLAADAQPGAAAAERKRYLHDCCGSSGRPAAHAWRRDYRGANPGLELSTVEGGKMKKRCCWNIVLFLLAVLAAAQWSPLAAQNIPITWQQTVFTNQTTTARSVVVRNINQSSHYVIYCETAGGSANGTIDIEGSGDGVHWVPISNIGTIFASNCQPIQAGGYWAYVTVRIMSISGGATVTAWYSAST